MWILYLLHKIIPCYHVPTNWGKMSYITWNALEEAQFVVVSHPDVENIISRPRVMEEELQTLRSRFGVKPAALQKGLVPGFSRGCAEVHEEAFPWQSSREAGHTKHQQFRTFKQTSNFSSALSPVNVNSHQVYLTSTKVVMFSLLHLVVWCIPCVF